MKTTGVLLIVFGLFTATGYAGEPPAGLTAAERGYWFILNKPYLIPDFDEQTFSELWRSWPKKEREQASRLDPAARRSMIFDYYGLTPRPDDGSDKPLQYAVTENGNYFMNCFACHGGSVAGQTIPGLPNSSYALQTLTDDIRTTKLRRSVPLSPRDLSAMFFPMGGTVGTTNAVMFGVALEHYRDLDMNVAAFRAPPQLVHHDMDAPPWWHFSKRSHLYIDGFVEKDHRALMPFVLIRENGRAQLDEWESDFKDIYAYLESVEPPKYPFEVDQQLAGQGRLIFEKNCSSCHGTYGENETYPQKIVPLAEIGTDPVRYHALTPAHRKNYGKSWLSHYGEREILTNPGGYAAPPLDGIWASAPYFHNGSVPTLAGVLNLEERPRIWKRTSSEFNEESIGLEITVHSEIPSDVTHPAERRRYFDASQRGKSNAGHDYPDALSTEEKRAVLEYLKTL